MGDGRDTVKALCAGGMNVVMMTHNPGPALELQKEVIDAGLPGKCVFYAEDFSVPREEREAGRLEQIMKDFGSIDVIISNTGDLGPDKEIEEITEEDLKNALSNLVLGSFHMVQTSVPYLKKSTSPRIILMTSVGACSGSTKESLVNCIAKGAVRSMALNLAERLAPYGITVNAVAKGPIPRIEGSREGSVKPETMLPDVPMGRLGTPVDLANVISFFASEESSYVTGQVLAVSGGMK